MIVGVCRLTANHLHLAFFESIPEVRVLPSTGITRLQRSYYPVRLPPMPPPEATLRPLPSHQTGLPRLPEPPFQRAVPTTPADRATILDSIYARARVNVNLELSRSGNGVRNGFRRPDGRGSGTVRGIRSRHALCGAQPGANRHRSFLISFSRIPRKGQDVVPAILLDHAAKLGSTNCRL